MAFARFRGFLSKANEFRGAQNIFSCSLITEAHRWRQPRDEATRLLFKRISPIENQTASIVPVLDQWVREGNEVHSFQLRSLITELRSYRRYSHALQMSMWMSEKRYISLTSSDVSVRLDLISKVRSIEDAESYFNNIPVHLRSLGVYGALLNCYANAKCVEKAESVMHKIRDLGLVGGSLEYSVLLGLYQQTGNYEKMESLIQEMEEKRIRFTSHTYSVLISACTAKSDTAGIEEILKKAESDGAYRRDWHIYSTAAQGYMEAGLMDKAVTALRNAEKFIAYSEKFYLAYDFLLTQYAKAGCRDDVLRVWEMYNKTKRVLNRSYLCFISSLLRLDDIETAEKVFEEWKSKGLTLDMRIPNLLIAQYYRKGLVEKAKAIIEEMISKGAKLNEKSWYWIASCHFQEGRSQEAVDAIKESLKVAVNVVNISKWQDFKDVLETCLKFLKEEGNMEEAEEFVRLIEQKCNVSSDVSERLMQYVRGEIQKPHVFGESEEL